MSFKLEPVVRVGGFTAAQAKHLQDEGRNFGIKVTVAWENGVRCLHMLADGVYYDFDSALQRLRNETDSSAELFTTVEDIEGIIRLPYPMHPADYKEWRKTIPELMVINPFPHGRPYQMEVLL